MAKRKTERTDDVRRGFPSGEDFPISLHVTISAEHDHLLYEIMQKVKPRSKARAVRSILDWVGKELEKGSLELGTN